MLSYHPQYVYEGKDTGKQHLGTEMPSRLHPPLEPAAGMQKSRQTLSHKHLTGKRVRRVPRPPAGWRFSSRGRVRTYRGWQGAWISFCPISAILRGPFNGVSARSATKMPSEAVILTCYRKHATSQSPGRYLRTSSYCNESVNGIFDMRPTDR